MKHYRRRTVVINKSIFGHSEYEQSRPLVYTPPTARQAAFARSDVATDRNREPRPIRAPTPTRAPTLARALARALTLTVSPATCTVGKRYVLVEASPGAAA